MMKMKIGLIIFCLIFPSLAYAHEADGDPMNFVWYGIIIGNLATLSCLYLRGWRQSAAARGYHLIFFILAVLSILAALLPPIDHVSEELLSIHMIQHMLLMMVGAPFFVFGYLDYYAKLGLSPSSRRLLWKLSRSLIGLGILRVGRPLVVAILYAFILWIWHLPLLYQSALNDKFIHNIQHLAFFIASYYFWKVLLRRVGRPALNEAAGIIYLFVASVHSASLGVLMALSPEVWYPYYNAKTMTYGLTALEDQQWAGAIMWMPAGTTYIVVAAWLVLKLLKDSDKKKVDLRIG